jgi:uncharacterized protein YcbX
MNGVADKQFMKDFVDKREQHLPSFANEEQFDHYYRLCVNTVIPATEGGKVLKLGDQLYA